MPLVHIVLFPRAQTLQIHIAINFNSSFLSRSIIEEKKWLVQIPNDFDPFICPNCLFLTKKKITNNTIHFFRDLIRIASEKSHSLNDFFFIFVILGLIWFLLWLLLLLLIKSISIVISASIRQCTQIGSTSNHHWFRHSAYRSNEIFWFVSTKRCTGCTIVIENITTVWRMWSDNRVSNYTKWDSLFWREKTNTLLKSWYRTI